VISNSPSHRTVHSHLRSRKFIIHKHADAVDFHLVNIAETGEASIVSNGITVDEECR